jgi:hypothetical protein
MSRSGRAITVAAVRPRAGTLDGDGGPVAGRDSAAGRDPRALHPDRLLLDRLFVPGRRWGWEFVNPDRTAPSGAPPPEPTWSEPAPPDVTRLTKAVEGYLPIFFGAGVVIAVLGTLAIRTSHGHRSQIVLAIVVAALLAALILAVPLAAITVRRRRWRGSRALAHRAYSDDLARHRARTQALENTQRHHRATADVLYPLPAQRSPQRTDVVGGGGDARAGLLAVFGTSVLASGGALTVLDLTEQEIYGGLANLAADAGYPVEVTRLPEESARADPLAGLTGHEAAIVLADAVDGHLSTPGAASRRAAYLELVRTVTASLGPVVTLPRIAAGLRVLAGLNPANEALLSARERDAVVRQVDAVAGTERARDELRDVRLATELLAGPAGGSAGAAPAGPPGAPGLSGPLEASPYPAGYPQGYPAGYPTGQPGAGRPPVPEPYLWWPPEGVQILATSSVGYGEECKQLTDQAVFSRIRHELRRLRAPGLDERRPRGPGGPGGPPGRTGERVLVIAGADTLAVAALEALTAYAAQVGTRVVLMFDHLREDTVKLVGGTGGQTIFMRMGNHQDAAAAAEYIGRGYVFQLSQLSHQFSRTFTAGVSDSWGEQTGESETSGEGGGRAANYSRFGLFAEGTSTNTNWSTSLTTSRMESWQKAVNYSLADGTTTGDTLARSYEFTVEPTELQTLPEHAFIMVSGAGGRRVTTAGYCNPAIAALDRVAPAPRGSLGGAAAPRQLEPARPGQPTRPVDSSYAQPGEPHDGGAGWVPVHPDSVRPPSPGGRGRP